MPRQLFLVMSLFFFAGCGSNEGRRAAVLPEGCALSFPEVGLCASVTWKSAPAVRQVTEATLRFFRATGNAKTGPFERPDGAVNVPSPRMPAMGHDSGEDPRTTAVAATVSDYRVENVFFNMRGKWSLTVELRKGGKVVETATLPLAL